MTYRWHLGLMMVCALAWAVGCDDSGGSDGDGGGGGGDAGDSGNVDDGSVDDGADDGEVAEEGSCATYCTNVQTNCSGDNEVYGEEADCLAACAAMPKGLVGDTSMNTVACRQYHANAAAGDADTHCPHAGISSAPGGCGTACDAYCDQIMANCTGGNSQYDTREDCETACGDMTDDGDEWNASSGDTVQCRAYHASYPAVADAEFHCPHAGEEPTAQCVDL